MRKILGPQDAFLEIPLSEIGQQYACLRLIQPEADIFMVKSICQYGQLLPVVVGRPAGTRYELVDGFKRVRACQKLGFNSVKARMLNGGVRVLKAAIIHLNGKSRSINDLEEAMVVHSLYREDRLNQAEIATLLGRHRSWVCRRISLIERLCDEVQSHIKLGLVSVSIARELAQLPRGNQAKALSSVLKHRLTYREAVRLIGLLLERPRWDHPSILRFPEEILQQRTAPRPKACIVRQPSGLHEKLISIESFCLTVSQQLSTEVVLTNDTLPQILSVVNRIEQICSQIKHMIRR